MFYSIFYELENILKIWLKNITVQNNPSFSGSFKLVYPPTYNIHSTLIFYCFNGFPIRRHFKKFSPSSIKNFYEFPETYLLWNHTDN
ncbi:hypothetical protein IQ37_04720 [Chryseobacterium piperi]|uniref:Uncharacterized protein n=1 Tax=Chryseobacterium piperi TaxID=558152 RepID=A0A086BKR9_9FLAO|nr:hypothetical protein CJF12_08765 [Chryseobacterium piperi]KFF29533.1 hypothetical protein IQ37_04720 [Chryseobacterium piperi]